jgi:hypothetical protein
MHCETTTAGPLLGSITPELQLYAVCTGCARVRPMALPALIGRYGRDTTIAAVRARLRCADCHRGDCAVRLVWAGVPAYRYRAPGQAAALQRC